MNTVQKIRRMKEISRLSKVQKLRIKDAEKRIMGLRRESMKLLDSMPNKDVQLYAEKITRYACAS